MRKPTSPPATRSARSAPNEILHVSCPKCGSVKGVVASTHYAEMMCFCPACEHVWDCPVEAQ